MEKADLDAVAALVDEKLAGKAAEFETTLEAAKADLQTKIEAVKADVQAQLEATKVEVPALADDTDFRALKEKLESHDTALQELGAAVDALGDEVEALAEPVVQAADGEVVQPAPAAVDPSPVNRKVFSPETDQPGDVDLNAQPYTGAVRTEAKPAPQPTAVADDAKHQLELVNDGEVAVLMPDPAADPGSTGSVAHVADDGSITVHAGVAPSGQASNMKPTIDPSQGQPATITAGPQTATEAAKETGADAGALDAEPVPGTDPNPVIEQPAA